jgi:hypothetical protein
MLLVGPSFLPLPEDWQQVEDDSHEPIKGVWKDTIIKKSNAGISKLLTWIPCSDFTPLRALIKIELSSRDKPGTGFKMYPSDIDVSSTLVFIPTNVHVSSKAVQISSSNES